MGMLRMEMSDGWDYITLHSFRRFSLPLFILYILIYFNMMMITVTAYEAEINWLALACSHNRSAS